MPERGIDLRLVSRWRRVCGQACSAARGFAFGLGPMTQREKIEDEAAPAGGADSRVYPCSEQAPFEAIFPRPIAIATGTASVTRWPDFVLQ